MLVAGTVVLSLMPSPPTTEVTIDDKLLHGITYFVLATWFTGIYRPERYAMVGAALLALGAVIELLQAAGGERLGEWFDLLANLTGILLGLGLARAGLGGWCLRVERLLSVTRRV